MSNYIGIKIEPKSINQLRKENPDLFYHQSWYDKEKFATAKPKAQTLWVRTSAVPDSRNKTYEKQLNLSGMRGTQDEEVPTANTVVQAMVAHYKATGERLFPDYYVRTADVDSGGSRVSLGVFGAGGLFVSDGWDDDPLSVLGLASSRKLEPGASSHETLEPLESLTQKLTDGLLDRGHRISKPLIQDIVNIVGDTND